MMAGALREMDGRMISQASDLETLGIIATRMLFCAGALQGPAMLEKALDEAAKLDLSMGSARRDLERLFLRDEFAEMGISFHTLM